MNKGLIAILAAIAVIGFAFYRLEKSRFSSKEIAVISCLAALAALGRIPFAAFPGVQPTTFLVMVSGFVFGPAAGFLVGASSAFASNIFLGHGPWTVWQMLGWGLCGCSAGALGLVRPRSGRLTLTLFAAAWGYLFGWIMNFWYWYSFVYPLSLSSWLAVNATSFPFDTMHALGNACFVLILANTIIKTLRYFKRRLDLSYISEYT